MTPFRTLVLLPLLLVAACGSPFFTPIPGWHPNTMLPRHREWFAKTAVGRIDTRGLGSTVSFTVESGVTVKARQTNLEPRSHGDYTWFGRTDQGWTVILAVRNGSVSGTVHARDITYRIVPDGPGLHAIGRLSNELPEHHPPSFKEVEQAPGPPPPPPQPTAHAPPRIEVIVAYTTKARTACPNVENDIQVAIDETNQASADSEVDMTLHLAHVYEATGYTEDSRLDNDLNRFQVDGDGELDEVHALRNRHNADIAVLVVDSEGSFLGTSAAIMAQESTAFAVVDCHFLAGYPVVAHEVGHLLGLRHEPSEDPATGQYPYGHGYRHDGDKPGDPAWATIMASNCRDNCQRIWHWSNPRVRYGDVPTGTSEARDADDTATSDSARALGQTAPVVEKFRRAR